MAGAGGLIDRIQNLHDLDTVFCLCTAFCTVLDAVDEVCHLLVKIVTGILIELGLHIDISQEAIVFAVDLHTVG